ncbi:hypothetical protein BDW67DRAFT_168074 [Aspergillus spinulosporus]
MIDNIYDRAPLSPAQQSYIDSSNNQRSRSRSMELTRTKHVRRPRHRASTQPLQMEKPIPISISTRESSPESNGGSARSSLETLNHPRDRSLNLPGSLLQQSNDCALTQSLQTPVRGSFVDTRSVAVTRLTPLNSHPPSSVKELEHTRSQSLDTNHHSVPPVVPPRPRYASLPVQRIRSSSIHSQAHESLAPAADSKAPTSHATDPASLLPIGPQAPVHAVFPPPQPQQQPQSEAIITARTSSLPPASSLPAPNPPSPIQSFPLHLEARQPPTHISLSKITTQSLSTLRTATSSISASKIHSSSTTFSSPRSKSNSSSSSSSTTSASTTSVPTPQLPPYRGPSPTNTFNLPLATLTQHVETQLSQARHLLATLSHHLPPAEKIWIYNTISETESTVREILMLTEPLRVDREVNNGRLGLKAQFKWAVRDSWKAKDMETRLNHYHSSLLAILVRLQDLEAEYAESVAENAAARNEMRMSDARNPMTNANVYVGGPTTSERGSLHKLSAVQMQDPSLEMVVDEPTGVETRSAGPESPISTISMEESMEPAPKKLDNELVDMLSCDGRRDVKKQHNDHNMFDTLMPLL